MTTASNDFLHALRQLRKSPAFTLVVILTIGLGIGANTAVFSVINGFLRPLPVKEPNRIVVLAAATKGDETGFRFHFSFPVLEDLRKQSDVFSDVFAFNTDLAGLTVDGKTGQFLYSVMTGNCFPALGIEPAMGQLLQPGEGESFGSESVVILGHSYWRKRFGGDPGVIGKQVHLDGKPMRIIGVTPEGFHGLYGGADMDGYLPLVGMARRSERLAGFFTDRSIRFLTVMARLKPGVSLRRAQSSMDVVAQRFEREYPATEKGIGIRVVPEYLARPLPLRFVADTGPMIRGFLLVLAGLVLMLSCMNVANLLLVRATIREREMAIRAALGSGRARLVWSMLTESALLALGGAVTGLVLGKWASDMFAKSINLNTDLPTVLDFSFDWRVFGYALLAAVTTALLIGALPARRVSRTDANAVLHDGGRGGSSGAGRQRVRSVLVVAQVAGSLVLLIVAGLFVRSLQTTERIELGFDSHDVLNVRMDPRYVGFDMPRTQEFYKELLRGVRALPGVQSASLAFSVPMGYIFGGDVIFVENRPLRSDEQPPSLSYNSIDGDYFETMRIPVVKGREFRETDSGDAPLVAIVNQAMAERFWPNQDPIGKRFRIRSADAPLREVVGVAHDAKYLAVFETPLPYYYVPLAQQYSSLRTLQIRSKIPPEALKLQVQSLVQSIEPDMPVYDLQTMQQSIDSGPAGFLLIRLGAIQAGVMGGLGLLLATIGVYGVVSYGASQRTREIGIRMAMGAHPKDIHQMLLKQGFRMIAVGAGIGLIAAVGLMRLASRWLVIVDTSDPATFVGVTLLVAAIALAACYIPARRAMRVDPMIALRHE
jgi:putative ABC transport system permease protein